MNSQVPVDLLPCPFCGKELEVSTRRFNPHARCVTDGCKGAQLPLLNIELPCDVVRWNTRATPAPIPDHLPDATKMVAHIPDAGEGVDFWWADEPLAGRALVMKVADHNRIVSALQASSGIPNGWKLVPVDPTIEMIAAIGFDGDVELAIGHAAISAQCVETYRNLLAASPALGDSQ